jgi:hypothetical protein
VLSRTGTSHNFELAWSALAYMAIRGADPLVTARLPKSFCVHFQTSLNVMLYWTHSLKAPFKNGRAGSNAGAFPHPKNTRFFERQPLLILLRQTYTLAKEESKSLMREAAKWEHLCDVTSCRVQALLIHVSHHFTLTGTHFSSYCSHWLQSSLGPTTTFIIKYHTTFHKLW